MQWTIIFCNWFTNAVDAKTVLLLPFQVCGWSWKGSLKIIWSNPLSKPGHPELVTQGHAQADFEYLWGWRLHSLPGQPVPRPAHPHLMFRGTSCVSCVMRQLWRLSCCVHNAVFTTFSNRLFEHSGVWYRGEEVFSAKCCFCGFWNGNYQMPKSKIRQSWGLSKNDSSNI